MSQNVNPLSVIAASPSTSSTSSSDSEWFKAMAEAWGKTLDSKADQLVATSDQISAGQDDPATITMLSTQSLEMSFLSQSAHTSIASVGTALETMARKQ